MSELRPCPFCGGEAALNTYRLAEDAMGCHVECTDCHAATVTFEDAYAPHSEAIAAWNTRATDAEIASLRAEVERLRWFVGTVKHYLDTDTFSGDVPDEVHEAAGRLLRPADD